MGVLSHHDLYSCFHEYLFSQKLNAIPNGSRSERDQRIWKRNDLDMHCCDGRPSEPVLTAVPLKSPAKIHYMVVSGYSRILEGNVLETLRKFSGLSYLFLLKVSS